ncbi:MAG: LLM class flavin-dependent oxidoreductase [Steroidobacteraceae bacterium]
MKLSIASLGDDSTQSFIRRAQLAEQLGFNALFHNDKKWARDPFVRLGVASQVTSRLGLGISVVDPYTRHAALLAQSTATLSEFAPGRLRVVMGAGSHFENLPGVTNRKPAIGIREACQLIRRLWNGERVTLDGEIVKFKDGALDWRPTALPPLYIASRGPQVLKLAGEVADGVLIGSFATPTGIEYAKRHIALGLQASGRTWHDIKLCSWIYLSVLDAEGDPIPESVRRGVSFALWSSRSSIAELVDQLAPDVTEEFRRFLIEGPTDWSPATLAELGRLIPRGMFDSLALVGTAQQISSRLRALQEAGIDEVVIWPFPASDQSVEQLMQRLAANVIPAVAA